MDWGERLVYEYKIGLCYICNQGWILISKTDDKQFFAIVKNANQRGILLKIFLNIESAKMTSYNSQQLIYKMMMYCQMIGLST